MKKQLLFLLLIPLFAFKAQAQNKERTPTYLLLKNATIIDGITDSAKQGDLLIKNQQIETIAYKGMLSLPKGTITYDLTDKYIIPGLIDAHVHLGTDPSNSDNLQDTQKRLQYYLNNGITAVRDMASDARFLAFLARAASLNELPAPNIYYSALMAGATFFDDPRTHASARGVQPGNCPWMKAVDETTNMPLAIAEAKGTGASGIKIYADLATAMVEKITTTAHQQELKVWSHAAIFPAKPLGIVLAGVDVISHATLLAWEGVNYLPSSAKGRYVTQDNFDSTAPVFQELIEQMKEKGTILDATLATYQHERFDTSIFLQGVALTKLAYQAGVKIGVGTDKGVADFPKVSPLLEEMNILVEEVGMSPIEVLKAATMTNAEMIGIEQITGSIEVGKRADLVVLEKNPLDNILNVGTVYLVVKNGEITKK